jgi:hypothetical protein
MLNFDVSSAAPLFHDGLTFLMSDEEDGSCFVLPADPAIWRRLHDARESERNQGS